MIPVWTDDELALRDSVAALARDRLNVDIQDRLRTGTFRRDLWEECASFGVLGMPLDASARYQRIASSTFGRVADSHVMRIDLRFYTGVWR